jgi:hypothetical protein
VPTTVLMTFPNSGKHRGTLSGANLALQAGCPAVGAACATAVRRPRAGGRLQRPAIFQWVLPDSHGKSPHWSPTDLRLATVTAITAIAASQEPLGPCGPCGPWAECGVGPRGTQNKIDGPRRMFD